MPGNRTRWLWVAGTIGAALVALAYGCVSEERVVAPSTSAPALAPQLVGDGGFSLIGDYFLPAPSNSVVGTPWRPTSITIPPGVIARITVTGMLVFEVNPDYQPCSGHAPQPLPYGPVIGPSGFSSVPFPFRVNIFLSNATTPPPARITLLPEDPAAETVVGYLQGFGAGVLWARRDGWGFACGSAAEYLLSGGATIVAEAVPPSELVPDVTSVKPGDTVTFHLNVPWTNEIQLGEVWRWIPDAGGSATTIVSGCRVGDMTCRFAVREKGHARLGGILLKSSFFIAAVSPTIDINTQDSTLTVKVTPTQNHFDPVFARCFNAVTQVADEYFSGFPRNPKFDPCEPVQPFPPIPTTRHDVTTIHVKAFWEPSGNPVRGEQLTLEATPENTSGGHAHGTAARPSGTFYREGEQPGQDPGSRGRIELTLSDAGEASAVYQTSGVSGLEEVRATVTSGGEQGVDSVALRISVDGLAEMFESANIHMVGSTDEHPRNHWGTPSFIGQLNFLADALHGASIRLTGAGVQFPATLSLNDMSISQGGLFDISGGWAQPHKAHRRGTSADIRVFTDPGWNRYALAIQQIWADYMGHKVFDERNLHHLHLDQ